MEPTDQNGPRTCQRWQRRMKEGMDATATGIARHPWKVLATSAIAGLVITVTLVAVLTLSPGFFVLDATEEGFKVANALESQGWDVMGRLWSGDYSDPLPMPEAPAPAPQPAAARAGGGQAGGGGAGGGGGGGFSSGQLLALCESLGQQGGGGGGGGGGGQRRRGGQLQRLCDRFEGMTPQQQQMVLTEFSKRFSRGGGGGGGRGSRGGATLRNQLRAVVGGGALVARARDTWRPYFVDVYAVGESQGDPTYFGHSALAYGCCGVFAKEQRHWPHSIDLLTDTNVRRVRAAELALLENRDFRRRCFQEMGFENRTQVGRVDPDVDVDSVKCARPISVTNFFWPTVQEGLATLIDCEELHDAGQYCEILDEYGDVLMVGRNVNARTTNLSVNTLFARIYIPDGNGTSMRPAAVVQQYLGDLSTRGLLDPTFQFLLDRSFGQGGSFSSRGLISRFSLEQPSERVASEEEQAAWLDSASSYLADAFLPSLVGLTQQTESLDFLAYSPSFLELWREEGVLNAVAWSCGALLAVYFLLWLRMRDAVADAKHASRLKRLLMSFVLPTGAMLHVVMSFPIAWAMYRFIYQQRYVGYMQFLSLFLALGIGVDDAFLMYDAWLQSKDDVGRDDLEGRMRFAWCRAARSMFITSVTDGLAFLANSFSAIAAVRLFGYLMATIVAVNYILDVTLFPALLTVVTRWVNFGSANSTLAIASNSSQPQPTVVGAPMSDEKPEKRVLRSRSSKIESFMQDRYSRLLHAARWGLLVLWVLLTASFAAGLSQLQRSDRAFRFETFPDWFPLNRIYNMGLPEAPGDIFGDAIPVQPIYIVLGVEGLDNSDTDSNNPLEVGNPSFSSSFDLADPKQQEGALKLCERLQTLSTTRSKQVLCPLRHFKDWYLQVDNGRWPEPNSTRFLEHLKFFVNAPLSPRYCLGNQNGDGSYELRGDKGRACLLFHRSGGADLAGLFYQALKHQEYPGYFGFDPDTDRLSWALVAVLNSTLSTQSAASSGRPVFDEVQAALQAASSAGETAAVGIQATSLWPQMVTEEAMMAAAWQGVLASLGVAAVTLLVFTQSPTLTVLCVLAVASIVTVTMGIMPAFGWRMGFLEAMCTVFVVGFSVDFVAHCAIAFQESKQATRQTRVAEALGVLSASLFWGMLTTVAAAFFLLFCVMVPFSKMGVFVILNQVASFVVAVCFFAAALMVFGPMPRDVARTAEPSNDRGASEGAQAQPQRDDDVEACSRHAASSGAASSSAAPEVHGQQCTADASAASSTSTQPPQSEPRTSGLELHGAEAPSAASAPPPREDGEKRKRSL